MKRVFTQTFGVVGAIIERDGKIILVKEAKKEKDTGKWNHPAGWIEIGENPIESVKREVKEEAGLTQVEAGKRLKKPQAYISKIERGERGVDAVELAEFAKLYGKSMNFFV